MLMNQKRNSATARVTTSLANVAGPKIGVKPGVINCSGFFMYAGVSLTRRNCAISQREALCLASHKLAWSGIDLDVPFIRRSTLGNFAPAESKGNFGTLYGWRNDGTNGRLNFWVWKVLFIFNPRPKLCSWLNFAGWRTL